MAGKKYHLEMILRAKNLASGVIKGAANSLGRTARQVASITRGIGVGAAKVGIGLGLLGFGAKQAGDFLAGLANDASDAGSRIADLSARTGIGARALQELEYAAGLAGVGADEFGAGVQTLTKNMGMLQAKSGPVAAFLKKVGPDFAKQLKGAKGTGEQLELVIQALTQIPDEAKRAALAQKLFGDSGVKLAAMAGQGAEGIRRARKEAHELGIVLDDEAIGLADEFGDEWERAGKAFGGVKRQLGVEIMRAALPLLQQFTAWVKDNKTGIKAFAQEFGKGVVAAVVGIKDALSWIWSHREDIVAVATGLAAGFAAINLGPILLNPIVMAVAAMLALGKAIADVIAMTPGQRKGLAVDLADEAKTGRNPVLTGNLGLMALNHAPGLKEQWRMEALQDEVSIGVIGGKLKETAARATGANRQKYLGGLAPLPMGGDVFGGRGLVEVTVKVQDPTGVLGTPKVEATKNAPTKVVKNGTRTADHFGGP